MRGEAVAMGDQCRAWLLLQAAVSGWGVSFEGGGGGLSSGMGPSGGLL